MVNIDPLLTVNIDGYYSPSPTSPAIQAAASFPPIYDIPMLDDDPKVLLDITGRPRAVGVAKDVGASHYFSNTVGISAVANRPLAASDVGPWGVANSISVPTMTPTRTPTAPPFKSGASRDTGAHISFFVFGLCVLIVSLFMFN